MRRRSVNRILILLLILTGFLSSGLTPKTAGNATQANFCDRVKPCQLLVQDEAEKILGQAVRLTENRSDLKGNVRQCVCAYGSLTNDQTGGQDLKLFFSLEQQESNPSAEQARQLMESTKSDNAHDLVITNISDIGDEAFLLGDLPNRHFIMARKGAVIMRLQVTRTTNRTSLEALKTFAQRVTRQL
jgi:hypothetical protein